MYNPGRVDLARVVAPPYDVIGPQDQQRYYERDPRNVVRLIAGEVRPTDTPEDNKYLRAAAFFRDWLTEGVLRREAEPAIYVYRHDFIEPTTGEARTRLGIMGAVQLAPFGEGILPHERTHARAKADRLSLTRAVRANLSPIFSLYEDPAGTVRPIVAPVLRDSPRLSIDGDEGEQHLVWSLTDTDQVRALARVLAASRLYVADGHHRYETALNFRNKMRAEHPDAPADAAFNFVLMLLVDVGDPGLTILPTHRLVHDLANFDGVALIETLARRYQVTHRRDRSALFEAMQQATDHHRIGLAVAQGERHDYQTVDIPRQPSSDPVSELEVSVLHREVLHDVLGIAEELLDEERHISYSRDRDGVLDRVASGAAQAAFLLRPPAVRDVVAVASAGQVMPQKSTYFYPKPASGIVFNPLDPEIQIPAV